MSEPYTLKKAVEDETVLAILNDNYDQSSRLYDAIGQLDDIPNLEYLEDWIAALKSGKKIVNPLSPKEEFFNWYSQLPENFWGNTKQKPSEFVDKAIEFISKEFHGVETWLKDGESNG